MDVGQKKRSLAIAKGNLFVPRQINFLILVTYSLVILVSACSKAPMSKPTPTTFDEIVAIPQVNLPTDVAGLISVLRGQDDDARVQAAGVLGDMGPKAEPAVPALAQNLYHFNFEVRRSAAEALGKIGPVAQSSVPILIVTLLEDSFVHAREASAQSLGKIGEIVAVPALSTALDDESDSVQIRAAISLALLTGQEFPDLHTEGGYSLNQEGVPIIVEAAKKWWNNEGRHQNWLGD